MQLSRGKIEAWTHQQIVDSAMTTLKQIYGKQIPEPIGYQITRWSSDPFAMGSYSYNPVGAKIGVRNTLAKPIAGTFFLQERLLVKIIFQQCMVLFKWYKSG